MNDLEKKLIKYENDAIAYETGEGKIAPNMFISPNECLILLNIKNTELRELRHANAVLTGACDMWADKYEALQAKLAASIGETVNAVRVIAQLRAELEDKDRLLKMAGEANTSVQKLVEALEGELGLMPTSAEREGE